GVSRARRRHDPRRGATLAAGLARAGLVTVDRSPAYCVLGRGGGGHSHLVALDAAGDPFGEEETDAEGLAPLVGRWESEHSPRGAGVTLPRCHDLRLVHRVLRHSRLVAEAEALRGATDWDTPLDPHEPQREAGATLFELEATAPHPGAVPAGLEETLAEFARQ